METLLQLNKQGLFPGPMEDETDFLARAQYCLHLSEHLGIPLQKDLLKEPNQDLRHWYDIYIDWIPIIFSNEKLAFWHGGCSWIFQQSESSPTGCFIQLRNAFTQEAPFLRKYSRKELLLHELAHAGRMKFEEKKFEEILAYATSPSWLRKWFGPIIQVSWENTILLISLFAVVLFDLYLLFADGIEYSYSYGIKAIPLVLIALACVRLALRQWQYHKCIWNLEEMLQSREKARAVAYRLTDKEICGFGKLTPPQIRKYADEQSEQEVRWKVLRKAYFENSH